MRALVFGVPGDPDAGPDPDAERHALRRELASTPMRLMEIDDPPIDDPERFGPDWLVVRPRLAGVCGSDVKQVFGDWGDVGADNPMSAFVSFPQVLGHEVVGDVVECGPEVRDFEPGRRVVLDPWLTCTPRGIEPPCPACVAGDLSLCWSFRRGRLATGIHTGTSRDATGGFAELMPAHDTMVHAVPDGLADELAVLADPVAVSLHAVTRHPPPPGGRVLVYGAGALGSAATAILRGLRPDVAVAVVARFEAQATFVRARGATVIGHEPASAVIEEAAAWSEATLVPVDGGLPMAYPGGIDVVYDTVGTQETLEVGTRLLAARGTHVKAGVHGPARWEDTPLYFKELSLVGSNAFGMETVEGMRGHGIDHALALLAGRVDLEGMVTHTFRLDEWREAFAALAEQDRSGAIKVAFDQRGERF